MDAPAADAPPAPSFATLHCRHSYDVSVPTIIDDLLDTRTAFSIQASLQKWLAIGERQPWETRSRRAFFVGDDKAYRPAVLRIGRAHSDLLATHRAVSTDTRHRLPFSEHAKYKATIYAHGFHFNSVRSRRLALLGGALIAEEGPCKEYWQMLAKPWQHYAPTRETFSDLRETAARLLEPSNDAEARAMAERLKALALRTFSPSGLMDYLEQLWRLYAELQQRAPSSSSSSSPAADSSPSAAEPATSGGAPRTSGRSAGPSRASEWKCTGWPADASEGSDRVRCLLGNRKGDAYEYGHNKQRGTRQALCKGGCACCRRRRTFTLRRPGAPISLDS